VTFEVNPEQIGRQMAVRKAVDRDGAQLELDCVIANSNGLPLANLASTHRSNAKIGRK
jgi:hypothetical protein